MKKITLFVPVLCALLCGQGCDKNNNPASKTADNLATENNPSSKKFRLAFVTNTTNDFWATVQQGCRNAAQQLGNVQLDFRFFTNSTVEEQEALVNSLVADGVDGIAISPIGGDKQTDFLKEIAAKKLLVCVDSDAPDS
jgi:ribose transport system substrate-binding protein